MDISLRNLRVKLFVSLFITITSILLLVYLIIPICTHNNPTNGTNGAMISLMLLLLLPLALGIKETIDVINELKRRKK